MAAEQLHRGQIPDLVLGEIELDAVRRSTPPGLGVDTDVKLAYGLYHSFRTISEERFVVAPRPLGSAAELARAREISCEPVHLVDYPECVIHLKGRPSARKIRDLHRYWFDTGVPLVAELQIPSR